MYVHIKMAPWTLESSLRQSDTMCFSLFAGWGSSPFFLYSLKGILESSLQSGRFIYVWCQFQTHFCTGIHHIQWAKQLKQVDSWLQRIHQLSVPVQAANTGETYSSLISAAVVSAQFCTWYLINEQTSQPVNSHVPTRPHHPYEENGWMIALAIYFHCMP